MTAPRTSHVVAAQQMPLLHAPSPMHLSLQTFTVLLHESGDSHAEPPSHRMSHIAAVHSMPTPQALALVH